MLEKLIENWLDSASERTYQPIFCQMLMNQGYTIIHSTRHMPIEFGKDVIAAAPDGSVHAYQLKGNPKSRINLTQYREIKPQLHELVHQKIINTAVTTSKHRSFLVTNGEIDEDVHAAIANENDKNKNDGLPNRRLETIARGQLLEWSKKLDTSLWPSELEDTKTFLEIITAGGGNLFPIRKFCHLLEELLGLKHDAKNIKKAELNRRAKSAALLTAVCLKPFSERQNHWAIISAWTLFSMHLIASAERYVMITDLEEQLSFAESIIFDHLTMLMHEVIERPECMAEGEGLSDFPVYSWRLSLLTAVGSLFWMWANKENTWPEGDLKDRLEAFLFSDERGVDIWGEAAFPQALIHIWATELKNKNTQPEKIQELLKTAIIMPLPCVYHDAEAVIRHNLSEHLEAFRSPIAEELDDKVSTSWFARQLMFHLACRNEKEICQDVWPEYSKITSANFIPETKWGYCLFRTKNGKNMSFVPKEEEQWDAVFKAANEQVGSIIPSSLEQRPWLMCFWMLICPHRALHQIINSCYKKIK